MKLNPGERSIMAYFPSSSKAEAALADLKSAGIEEIILDRVSRYDHFNDNDTRILMAADPSVSGNTRTEGYGLGGGKSFLLAVVTSEDKVNQAIAILEQHEAEV